MRTNTKCVRTASLALVLLVVATPGVLAGDITTLVPPTAAVGAHVGRTVAIDGDRLVLGAPDDVAQGAGTSGSGVAYVYARDTSTGRWTLEARLTGREDAGLFAESLALDDRTLVVGAPYGDSAGTNTGEVYVFVRADTQWRLQALLTPSDAQPGQQFGSAVTLEGDLLAIGAPLTDGQHTDAGAAYVFRRLGNTWLEVSRLDAREPAPFANLGAALALAPDRDTLAIGAPGGSETVHVFSSFGLGWAERARLVCPEGPGARDFGAVVALHGQTLAVSAPLDGGAAHKAGAVYVFEDGGEGWQASAALRASDAEAEDEFGHGLCLVDGTLFVGAPFEGGLNEGAVYRYHKSAFGWSERAKLVPTAEPTTFFGMSIDLDGPVVLVGAPDFEHFAGSCCAGMAYIVSLVDG